MKNWSVNISGSNEKIPLGFSRLPGADPDSTPAKRKMSDPQQFSGVSIYFRL